MSNGQAGHQHIFRKFDDELEAVRNHAMAMGGLVEKQLGDAIRAIVEGDSELGDQVVSNDYRINAMEVAIDEECTRIIALRQPAAVDLRLIISIIKTITDLERMGDEAERIGRMAVRLAGRERPQDKYSEIRHLGNHVRQMLQDTLDAFARSSVESALAVVQEDRKVDHEYEGIMRQQIALMMEDPRSIPRALEVMWSARALERIGDRACNICEYIIYLVEGRDVRHTSIEQVRADLDRH